jgi:hypothetical protein
MDSVLLKLACLSLLTLTQPVVVSAGSVRISQVYPGGGISSAGRGPYSSDYVELFNSGSSAVDISGWILAYGGSNPSTVFGSFPGTTLTIPLGSSISPCAYFLIQTSEPSPDGGSSLPAPDAKLVFSNPNLIPGFGELQNSGGALALLNGGTPSGGCIKGEPGFQDDVAWHFGCSSFLDAFTQAQALIRKDGGMVSSGDANSDFVLGSPTPRNSTAAKNPTCVQSPALPLSWGRLKTIFR